MFCLFIQTVVTYGHLYKVISAHPRASDDKRCSEVVLAQVNTTGTESSIISSLALCNSADAY